MPRPFSPGLPPRLRLRLLPLLGLFPGLLAAEDPAPRFTIESRPAPERNYRLFVGVDIKVRHDDDLATVTDFGNNRALLETPAPVELPVDAIDFIRFDHATKLGRVPVTIATLTSRRAHAAGNPRWDWMIAQSGVQGQVQDQLSARQRQIARNASLPTSGAFTAPDGTTIAASNPLADAIDSYVSYSAQTAKLSESSFYAEQAESDGDAETFDALVVESTLSAPVPVTDVYAVGIARISHPTNGYSDVVFFHEVGRLGPEPRTVRMHKAGLPPGFAIVSVDLHLYCQGRELVSDRSPKQFALSREEALEFLTLDRSARHRGETLPAEPAWDLAPEALLAVTDPAALDLPLIAQVDAHGQLTHLAPETAGAIPARIYTIANQLPFLPALDNGMPVAGTAHFNLKSFFR